MRDPVATAFAVLSVVLFAVLSVQLPTSHATATCPHVINGSCYDVVSSPNAFLPLWRAELACNAWGGHLSRVDDAVHLAAIRNITTPPYAPAGNYLIGLHGTSSQATFNELKFTNNMDGTVATFFDWPNTGGGPDTGDPDLIAVSLYTFDATGMFRQHFGDYAAGYVCRGPQCDAACWSCSPGSPSDCLECPTGFAGPPLCATLNATFCAPLEAPRFGSIDCSQAAALGSVCTVTCDAGYELWGSSSRTCSARPRWQGSEPYWSHTTASCNAAPETDLDNSALFMTAEFGGRAYALTPSAATWEAARDYCLTQEMDLISPSSPEELAVAAWFIDDGVWVGAVADPHAQSANLRDLYDPMPYLWSANASLTAPSSAPVIADGVNQALAYWPGITGETSDPVLQAESAPGSTRRGLCSGLKCPGHCMTCTNPSALTCTRCMDGWTGPACATPVQPACPPAAAPLNGYIVDIHNFDGGNVTVGCNAGYKLVGARTRHCRQVPDYIDWSAREFGDVEENLAGAPDNRDPMHLGAHWAGFLFDANPSGTYDDIRFVVHTTVATTATIELYIWAEESLFPATFEYSGPSGLYDLTSRPRAPVPIIWSIPPTSAYTDVTSPSLVPLFDDLKRRGRLSNRVALLINATDASPPGEHLIIEDRGLLVLDAHTVVWSSPEPTCVALSNTDVCDGGLVYEGSCYTAHTDLVTWKGAADLCAALPSNPGHIYVPSSAEEALAVNTYIDASTITDHIWLGLVRPAMYMPFVAIDTGKNLLDPTAYTAWSTSGDQPNEPISQNVVISNTADGTSHRHKWQDRPSSATPFQVVCESPMCVSPCATCVNDHTQCATCRPGFGLPPRCALTPPAQPSSTGVRSATKTSVTLTWTPPLVVDPEEPDLHFVFEVDGADYLDPVSLTLAKAYSDEYTLQGLAPSTVYVVRIFSAGLAGRGDPAPAYSVRTLVQCPPSTAPSVNSNDCTDCEPGSYSPDGNGCIVCPTLTTSPAASRNASQCECVAGFYNGRRTGSFADAPDCLACPPGALCDGGSAPPRAAPGYFPGAEATVFIECPNPAACTGSGTCAPGHTGRLCSSCSTGYYQLSGTCHECSPLGKVLVAVFVLAAFGVVAFLVWFNTQSRSLYKYAAMMIGLTSLQISAMYGELPLDWPGYAKTVFDVLSFANLNIELTSPECGLGASHVYRFKFVLTMLGPLLLLIPFGVIYVINEVYGAWVDRSGPRYEAGHTLSAGAGWAQRRWHRFRTQSMVRGQAMVAVMARAYFQLMTVLFLPLTSVAMSYYDCARDKDGRFSHVPYPADECFKGGHAGWLPFAVVFTAVYCVALPGGIVFLLFNRRRSLGPLEFALRYGFLVARFRESAFAFEVAIMARKLGVVLAMTSSYAVSNPHNKAFYGVLFLAAAGAHVSFVKPYHMGGHNALSMFCIVTSILVLLLGASTSLSTALRNVGVGLALTLNLLAIVVASVYDAYQWASEKDEIEETFEMHSAVAGFDDTPDPINSRASMTFDTAVSLSDFDSALSTPP